RWVPEIAHLDNKHLQEPWRAGGAPGYPAPIVDVVEAARAARDKVFAVRKGTAFRTEANAIVKKHASRKSDRGFQRDPMPGDKKSTAKRRRPSKSANPDQMSLDL
ncbi:MAG: deoxyribodipyrimidine photolyase, partial [Pseudomonadota bacterium]